MKKIIFKIYALFSLLSLLVAPSLALADSPLKALQQVTQGSYAQATPYSLAYIAGVVVRTALSLLGIIFIILIIYAGIIWMTAEGDEAKVEKAQKIMRNAIIGLIITIGVYAIYAVIQGISLNLAG